MLYSKVVNKLTIGLIILAVVVILIIGKLVFFSPKSYLTTPQTIQKELVKAVPSKTLKSYTDPSGFTFSYPDNLSLINNESTSSAVYSDLSLSSKEAEGGLNINISDSKSTTLDQWVKTLPTTDSKEISLGNLKALEITAGDKLYTGALDLGVLFKLETSIGKDKDFWMTVYQAVIKDFSFVQPAKENTSSVGASNDVSFEGEEVVE